MANVTITTGPAAGREIEIGQDETIIGRARDCHICIADQAASSHHCAIIREGDEYWIRDLGSTNGTRLNGEMVVSSRLKPGDAVMAGSTEIQFSGDDVLVDESVLAKPPISAPVPTVVMSSGLAGVRTAPMGAAPAFAARRTPKWRWMALSVLVLVALVALAYWFLRGLLQTG